MANIKIPDRFNNKIGQNQEIDGIIKTTLSSFGNILEESKLYFFNEYTNHGIKHIQDVLASSDNFITDKTFENILQNKDVGYYILSVILHDIGMHIDLDGFKHLIDGTFDDVQIKQLDKNTWGELWEDFLSEARKFSGKQLKNIFGNENTIVRIPPFSNPGDLTENDKKLIGEFIRRHHSRLAHEIALKGFPAKPRILEFANGLDIKNKNIIGLIARSHGTKLRTCLDYIELVYGRENRRCPLGIHTSYLMALLRLADYIQIDSSRTSSTLLKTKTFSSPISEMEHYAHFTVDNIDYRWQDDPERIFVNASPKDSKMYLKLKKLITDIQKEFDISWAVLGELYGKGNEKEKPEIRYRRITSNLDDDVFIAQQNYVADSFAFIANDELIKLLVAPLYGDDPKYGVRELLQNAVDACKEREKIEKKSGKSYSALITIKIHKEFEDNFYFVISDNGVGMDTDVIKNYFFSAGASYRKSSDWQKEFLDSEGKSVVRRSGRFGVGILAAFLIGEEIYVETKKINHSDGYVFNADLNSDQINILKNTSISVGTVIRIKIDNQKIKTFLKPSEYHYDFEWFEWYTLSNPTVKYLIDDTALTPAYTELGPDFNDSLPIEWHTIDSEGYDKILWKYDRLKSDTTITCNGIIIPGASSDAINYGLISNHPRISIFDSNAILPLSLDRNSFTKKLSFNNELVEDIYKDFIAYLLISDHYSYVDGDKIYLKSHQINHPGTTGGSYSTYFESGYGFNRYSFDSLHTQSSLTEFLNTILISKNGFILNYNYFLQKVGTINVILIQYDNLSKGGLEFDIKDRFILLTDNKLKSIQDYLNAIEAKNFNNEKKEWDPFDARIFIKTDRYKFLFQSPKKRVTVWLNNLCKVQFEKYGFTCLHLANPKPSLITDSFIEKNATNLHFIREYEITCPFKGDELLDKLLEKYIGDNVVIPFSVEERRKKYPLAFKELESYMAMHIAIRNKEEKEQEDL
jgi:hypothetical protein